MRNLVAAAVVSAGTFAVCAADALVLTPEATEVVVAKGAPPSVMFAVEELTNALAGVWGRTVPVLKGAAAAKPGVKRIYLGENEWTSAAGLKPAELPRDGFAVKVTDEAVYIAGVDDPKARIKPEVGPYPDGGMFELGTVHGVYEFLERYAGVRYFFPGEIGTVYPKADRIVAATGAFTVAPEYRIRHFSAHDLGRWYEPLEGNARERAKNLACRRYRMRTDNVHVCHGQYRMKLVQRFGKTHPEYFVMGKDGQRIVRDTEKAPFSANAHLCHTSDIWKEIEEEAVSYFRGEDASVRGCLMGKGKNLKVGWGNYAVGRQFYDVMANDGLPQCRCAKCQAAYDKDKGGNWGTSLLWRNTAKVAQRLLDEKLPGTILQMAYPPCGEVPDFELPTNVLVMVARNGAWTYPHKDRLAKEIELIDRWVAKTHNKVFLWTYQWRGRKPDFNGIPFQTPRATGAYYSMLRDRITGGYLESNTEAFIYNYMDFYVYGKVCWNTHVDVEALLADHDEKMFGPAAKPMRTFFDILEEKWLEVVSTVTETPLGPAVGYPSAHDCWTRIYSKDLLARLDALLAEAERIATEKTGAGSLTVRRVRFFREQYYGAIKENSDRILEQERKVADWTYRVGSSEPLKLGTWVVKVGKVEPAKRATDVTIERTADTLKVVFDCEEESFDRTVHEIKKQDLADVWSDDSVEFLIDMSGDKGTDVAHFILSSAGVFYDSYGYTAGLKMLEKPCGSLDAGAKTSVERTARGWRGTIEIPLKALPPIPARTKANFCRNRNVGTGMELLHWSKYATHFRDYCNWGTLVW